MTAKLAQTNRALLLDMHARLPSIEEALQALLAQKREREADRATLHLAVLTIDRLLEENAALMQMVGRMTFERKRFLQLTTKRQTP